MAALEWLTLVVDQTTVSGQNWVSRVASRLRQRVTGGGGNEYYTVDLDRMVARFSPGDAYPSGIYVNPSEIVEQMSSNYTDTMAIGRHESVRTFINNSPRTISFPINLVADAGSVLRDGKSRGPHTASREEVLWSALWLEALKSPFQGRTVDGIGEGTDIDYPPPRVNVSIGDMISMRAVLTACRIQWGNDWSFTSASAADALPMSATVHVTFTSAPTGFTASYGAAGPTSRNYK
jgi:hypothetical protein